MTQEQPADAIGLICAFADERLGLAPGTFRQGFEERLRQSEQAAEATRIARAILAQPALAETNSLGRFLAAAAALVLKDHEAACAVGADMRKGLSLP